MRRCLIDDLLHGARAISGAAPAVRRLLADSLIEQAHAAHAFAKRFGRPHPRWGNGSLLTRAMAECPLYADAEVSFDAIAIMADAIARFRRRNSAATTLVCSPVSPYVTFGASKGDCDGRNQNQTRDG